MGSSVIFDRTVSQIQDRLNLISQSHRLVSHNLANANTPGYQAKDISFKSFLEKSLGEGKLQLVKSSTHHITTEGSSPSAINAEVEEKGPVSLEQEMMKLARNSIEYQYMVTMLNKKFANLKHVISEGVS
jgi:flagellar basal-body rod protein FlgB